MAAPLVEICPAFMEIRSRGWADASMSYAGIHGNPGSSPWLVSTLSCKRLSPNHLSSTTSAQQISIVTNQTKQDVWNEYFCHVSFCIWMSVVLGFLCVYVFGPLGEREASECYGGWGMRLYCPSPPIVGVQPPMVPMNQAVCSLDSLFGSASVLHLSTQTPSPLSTAPLSILTLLQPPMSFLFSIMCVLFGLSSMPAGPFSLLWIHKSVIFSRFCEKIFWERIRKGKRPWTSCSILFPLPSRRLLTSKVEALNGSICAELRWSWKRGKKRAVLSFGGRTCREGSCPLWRGKQITSNPPCMPSSTPIKPTTWPLTVLNAGHDNHCQQPRSHSSCHPQSGRSDWSVTQGNPSHPIWQMDIPTVTPSADHKYKYTFTNTNTNTHLQI